MMIYSDKPSCNRSCINQTFELTWCSFVPKTEQVHIVIGPVGGSLQAKELSHL